MAGTTPNYGWGYVDSGADPVSGPANFAHVPQIDATLKTLMGNVSSMRVGVVNMNGGCTYTAHVTISPAMVGDQFYAIATTHSTVPGTVQEVAVFNENSTGFDVIGCRSNATVYTVNWVFYGVDVP